MNDQNSTKTGGKSSGRHWSRIAMAAIVVLLILVWQADLLLTSLVVVAAFVPLAFVTGLMGSYMAPMALTVPIAMMGSTAVATLAVPWLAQLLLAGKKESDDAEESSGEVELPANKANPTSDDPIFSRLFTSQPT